MICKHFSQCGGCSLQNLSYQEQLLKKQEYLKLLFQREVHIHPSPKQFRYRSRMDFIFSEKLGLHAKESHKVIEINECLLISERANNILNQIRELTKKFSSYNYKTHKGFLRYLTIRETDELMLIFTTNKPEDDQFENILRELQADSIYWFVYEGKTDDSILGNVKKIIGKDHITETLLGKTFNIKPRTFFQANKDMTEIIFTKIKQHVKGRTLDLGCGVGSITITADASIGIDEVKESIKLAKENATLNNANTTFIHDTAQNFIKTQILQQQTYDTIILDPPRKGFGDLSSLQKLRPETIIYMSCNPRTLKKDMFMLPNYKLDSLEAFDMFPQTDHIECLAIFRRVSGKS